MVLSIFLFFKIGLETGYVAEVSSISVVPVNSRQGFIAIKAVLSLFFVFAHL